MNAMKYERALSKAMAICSKSEKCISDIDKKLTSWEVSRNDSDKIIDTLILEKFIDETRFAGYYARDKFRFNHWGKTKIRFMLAGKKIPKQIIKNSLQLISDTDYQETLVELLNNKRKNVKADSTYELKSKLIRFAQGRGFEYNWIEKALQQLNLEE